MPGREEWWIFEKNQITMTQNPRPGFPPGGTRIRMRPDVDPGAVGFQTSTLGRNMQPKGMNSARFEIDGKTLRFCMSMVEGTRPDDVSCRPNSRRRLFILERIDEYKVGYSRNPIHVAKGGGKLPEPEPEPAPPPSAARRRPGSPAASSRRSMTSPSPWNLLIPSSTAAAASVKRRSPRTRQHDRLHRRLRHSLH